MDRAGGLDRGTSLDEVDRLLHEDRLEAPGRMRRWTAAVADLPGGAMVAVDGTAHLAHGGALHPWSPAGYGPARAAPPGRVEVLTPRTIVAAIAAGYEPVTALASARERRPARPGPCRFGTCPPSTSSRSSGRVRAA